MIIATRSPFGGGLGWQPDLPDMRDKTFLGALHKRRAAIARAQTGAEGAKAGSGRQAKGSALPTGNPVQRLPHEKHTFEGWETCSGRLEQELQTAGAVIKGQEPMSALLAEAKKVAFGGPRPKLLLDHPLLAEGKKPLDFVDLRPFMSPVENQEHIGSCTAQAVMGAVEYLQIATRGDYVDGSRLFLYKTTRSLLGWSGDTGAYIRETIKALRLFGICPEPYWTYDTTRYDEEPASFCYAFASNYKNLRYYRLAHLEEIKHSITQGYPVAFGFTCLESLFTPTVQASGIIPFPNPKEKVLGGHAVLAVGYNQTGAERNRCPDGHVIIRNSWGSWGDAGYGYLPFEYFEPQEQVIGDEKKSVLPLADDFWAVTQIEAPEPDLASSAPFALAGGNRVQRASPFKNPVQPVVAGGNPVQD